MTKKRTNRTKHPNKNKKIIQISQKKTKRTRNHLPNQTQSLKNRKNNSLNKITTNRIRMKTSNKGSNKSRTSQGLKIKQRMRCLWRMRCLQRKRWKIIRNPNNDGFLLMWLIIYQIQYFHNYYNELHVNRYTCPNCDRDLLGWILTIPCRNPII